MPIEKEVIKFILFIKKHQSTQSCVVTLDITNITYLSLRNTLAASRTSCFFGKYDRE